MAQIALNSFLKVIIKKTIFTMNRKPAIIVLLLFCCLFGCNYGKKTDNSIVENSFPKNAEEIVVKVQYCKGYHVQSRK